MPSHAAAAAASLRSPPPIQRRVHAGQITVPTARIASALQPSAVTPSCIARASAPVAATPTTSAFGIRCSAASHAEATASRMTSTASMDDSSIVASPCAGGTFPPAPSHTSPAQRDEDVVEDGVQPLSEGRHRHDDHDDDQEQHE